MKKIFLFIFAVIVLAIGAYALFFRSPPQRTTNTFTTATTIGAPKTLTLDVELLIPPKEASKLPDRATFTFHVLAGKEGGERGPVLTSTDARAEAIKQGALYKTKTVVFAPRPNTDLVIFLAVLQHEKFNASTQVITARLDENSAKRTWRFPLHLTKRRVMASACKSPKSKALEFRFKVNPRSLRYISPENIYRFSIYAHPQTEQDHFYLSSSEGAPPPLKTIIRQVRWPVGYAYSTGRTILSSGLWVGTLPIHDTYRAFDQGLLSYDLVGLPNSAPLYLLPDPREKMTSWSTDSVPYFSNDDLTGWLCNGGTLEGTVSFWNPSEPDSALQIFAE